MRPALLRSRAGALVVIAALTLAACAGDDSTVQQPAAAATINGIATAHNDADIAFIKDMTPHHQGAVGMAELAADRAANPKVVDLAARIVAAQAPELAKMADMAKAWGVSLDGSAGGHGGAPATGHSGGGAEDDDVAALKPLSGAAFDREFLARMIKHHESALPMSQANLDKGQNPQAKALATAIIATQTAEIAEMKALLAAA